MVAHPPPPPPSSTEPKPEPIPYARPLPYARPDLVRPLPHLDPWHAAVMHFFPLGVFSWVWFNKMHDRLPRVRRDDPSSHTGAWFCLIPILNLYWIFFTVLRLVERIDEQRVLYGLKPTGCRVLAITFCVSLMVPYYNLLIGLPVFGTILAWELQAKVNEIAGREARMPGVELS